MEILKLSCAILAMLFLAIHANALEIMPPPDISHTPLHEAAKQCDLGKARQALATYSSSLDKTDRNNYTPLMLAAENGCHEVVALLTENGAIVDAGSDRNKRTALMYAAEQNHAAIVGYLLAKGADPNNKTNKGDTPLTLALKGPFFPKGPKGNVRKTVANLLDHRAEVNVQGEFGRTPLMLAVNQVDAFLVSQLLQNGPDTAFKDDKGETAASKAEKMGLEYLVRLLNTPQQPDLTIQGLSTPLVDAINSKKISAVAAILETGTNVNARFGNGSTALMSAAQTGQKEVVRRLLHNGAEVNTKNGSNSTAIMYAVTEGYLDVTRMLMQAGADIHIATLGRPPLFFAVQNNRIVIARLLLDKGANPNGHLENTPLLSIALKNSNSEMARLLIAQGAKVDAKDSDGMTPLILACKKDDRATVKALIAKGADINLTDNKGSTALTYAISEKRNEIVALLLASGAKIRTDELNAAISTRNLGLIAQLIDNGAEARTSLLAALPNAGLELVKLLIQRGADPNARNSNEKTALILEVESWSEVNLSVVRYLLNHKANVNAQDDKGMSALLATVERGNISIAKALLEKKANTALRNNNGKSAWLLAAEKNDQKMMQLLERSGAPREYEQMNWEGSDATQAETYKGIVSNSADWEKLWQKTFSKPAPPIDFENFVVACVFLGDKADWLYSINFGPPYTRDEVTVVPYDLIMKKLEMLRIDSSFGQHSFSGQYHMKAFAKQKGYAMQLLETKGEGDGRELLRSPPGKMEQGSQPLE